MIRDFSTTTLLIALSCLATAFAGPAHPLEPRSGSVCSSGIYGELAPILAGYSIAQAFCTSVYPVKCTTAKAMKRAVKSTTTSSTKTLATTTTTKSTTTSAKLAKTTTKPTTTSTTATDAKYSAWSKCQAQGGNVVSTMCSCIEAPPKACPTTKSTTTITTTTTTKPITTTTTTTTTTSTAPAVHTVAAPRCNSAEFDNGGCNDQCVCQSDVDGTEYCISQFSYEDPSITCTSDDDCPQGDICESLDTASRCATGTQPGNECYIVTNPSRLFRAR